MSLQCPHCSSASIIQKRSAQKTGARFGAIGGLSHGINIAVIARKTGAVMDTMAGPTVAIAGAVLGGLVGCIALLLKPMRRTSP